jgi:photosystem II stability/assembly factor-like uncharacterized protein
MGWRALILAALVVLGACTSTRPATVAPTSAPPATATTPPFASPTLPTPPAPAVSPPPETILSAALVAPDVGWRLTTRRVLYTSNGGTSWISNGLPAPISFPNKPDGQFFVDGSTAWLATVTSTVTVTRFTNGGMQAQSWSVPSTSSAPALLATLSFLDTNLGFLATVPTDGHGVPSGPADLYRTADGGATWSLVTSGAPITGPIHFASPSDGWAIQTPLIRTTDGGKTWQAQQLPSVFHVNLPPSTGVMV